LGLDLQQLQTVALSLKSGNVVALPTETVYGLAANAFDKDAVRNIFQIKGRPLIDPLIVHVYSLQHLLELTTDAPLFLLEKLEAHFWPGPLTVILKKKKIIPDIVTASKPTVAIRIPKHPIFRQILKFTGLPLAAPSANPFGYLSPTCAEHVQKTLGDRIPLIIDGGRCEYGLESTILNCLDPAHLRIVRPGPITAEALESVLKTPVKYALPKFTEPTEAQLAPGLLKKHYSPKTPLFLVNPSSTLLKSKGRVAFIHIERPILFPPPGEVEHFWLSQSGSLHEVAQNIFHLLQHLDHQKFDAIYIEKVPQEGIGIAINDRLERAASH